MGIVEVEGDEPGTTKLGTNQPERGGGTSMKPLEGNQQGERIKSAGRGKKVC